MPLECLNGLSEVCTRVGIKGVRVSPPLRKSKESILEQAYTVAHDVYLCNRRAQFLVSNHESHIRHRWFQFRFLYVQQSPLTTRGTLALLAIHLCPMLVCCRAMEFVQDFMAEVAGGEHSLDIAAGKAYTQCLRRYHNWIVRGMFSVSAVSLIKSYTFCWNRGVLV